MQSFIQPVILLFAYLYSYSCSNIIDGNNYILDIYTPRNLPAMITPRDAAIELFDLPELAGAFEDEPELEHLLSLNWCRHDPFLLFLTLVNDILSGKKTYNALYRPLIMAVIRKFNDLNEEQKNLYLDEYSKNIFLYKLAYDCSENGRYDLAFEILKDDTEKTLGWFDSVKDRKAVFDFLKFNPNLAKEYVNCFSQHDENVAIISPSGVHHEFQTRWITECIFYDAPIEFYEQFLLSDPGYILRKNYQLLELNINDSDKSRIHELIKNLLTRYFWSVVDQNDPDNIRDYYRHNLLNNIHLGSNNLIFDVSEIDVNWRFYVLMIAFKGNKRGLFNQLRNLLQEQSSSALKRLISGCLDYTEIQNNLKIILDLFVSDLRFRDEIFSEQSHVKLLLKYYAIKGLSAIENGVIVVEFVAIDDLLEFDFPNEILVNVNLKQKCQRENFERLYSYIQIIDEELFTAFLSDYEAIPDINRSYAVEVGFIELIANYPNLIDKLEEQKTKFIITWEAERILNLPNFDSIIRIFEVRLIDHVDVTQLKTIDQLQRFEKLSSKSVADYFLRWQRFNYDHDENQMKNFYLQWRFALSYWISGDQKGRIREITIHEFKRLLNLEYPNESEELLV